MKALRGRAGHPPIVLFKDVGRFGRISERADCWDPRPVRPLAPRQVVLESLYDFGAVEPQGVRLVRALPGKCNTASMPLFLLDLLAADALRPITLTRFPRIRLWL